MSRSRPTAPFARLGLVLALALAVPLAIPVVAPATRTEAAAAITTPFASAGSQPIAPSTVHDWGSMATGSGPQAVHFVDVNPADPAIVLEATLSNDRVRGLETTTSQALRASTEGHRAVAAINGDIWSGYTSETLHAPHGLHVQAGELVTAGPIAYPSIGFRADDSVIIGSPIVGVSVTTATAAVLAANRVNQSRRSGDFVLYSPRFGSSTGTDAAGTEVVLSGAQFQLTASGAWTVTVSAVRRNLGNTAIGAGTLVLSASSTSTAAPVLGALVPGQPITLQTSISAGWEVVRQAISGREWVVRDGAVSIFPRPDSADQIHPRSAVGVRADGTIMLVTVDGRQAGYSAGVKLDELGQLLIARGAVSAINLDGGGSTTLALRQPGNLNVSIANRPSDGRERAVTNALVVYSTAPTGPLATLTLSPGDRDVYQGSAVTYTAKGVDAAINPVPIPTSSIAWALDGAIGTLDAAGRLQATTIGTGTVAATAGGVTGAATVTVIPDNVAPVASAPVARFTTGSIARTTASMTISWGATDVGLGVASYELRTSVDGAPWTPVALAAPAARSLRLSLPLGHRYRYQVRATDRAGNVGGWESGSGFRLRMLQETAARYSSSWTAATGSGYIGGRGRYSKARGAVAKYTFTGSQVAWVGPKGRTRGSARVYVDGAYQKTVSLYAAATNARVLYSKAWSTTGRHTLEIRVSGTAGHPRVDVDAFLLIDPPTPDPVLVGAGDIASCVMTGDSATAKLLDGISGTVFTAGDNAYEQGTAAQYTNCYHPTWGRHRARTKPVPGNHEYLTAGAAGYFGYFGSRAGTQGQGWYAFDLGAWRIYALNSNCDQIGGCETGSAQETWLRADLAANPRQCVLAIFHHPMFSSGVHGNDLRMGDVWAALYEAGADVIVNGHDHDYERFAPQTPDGVADDATGIRQFVVGTGGAGLRAFGTIRANSQVRSSAAHGVIKLTLRPTSYAWSFVPVAGKTFKDSGSTLCH